MHEERLPPLLEFLPAVVLGSARTNSQAIEEPCGKVLSVALRLFFSNKGAYIAKRRCACL